MVEIKLGEIKSKVFERSEIDEEKLNELAESIEKIGVAQPLLVRPAKNGYELVIGGRRVEGAKKTGKRKVPAVVRDVSDREALELVLTENIHREEMTDLDKGKICQLLMERFPDEYPSQSALADKLSVAQQTVSEWVGLTELPEGVQNLVAPPELETGRIQRGKIGARVARHIGKIEGEERKIDTARAVAERGLTERRSRRVVKKVIKEPEKSVAEIIEEDRKEPELIFKGNFKERILKGRKTQTARSTFPGVKKGDEVWAHFTEPRAFKLKVTDVYKKELGEFDENDAEREGGYALKEFKKVWEQIANEPWDPERSVFVVRFKKSHGFSDSPVAKKDSRLKTNEGGK